jgi:aminoglycoside phosphotransferase (APT) family kinase protein
MIDAALFAELRDLCLRSFPERLDQRLSQVKSTAAGRHPALAFSLSWREGLRPRVERLLLQRYADDWTWWSNADDQKAQREWEMLRWLYGRGLPAPKPYALGAQNQDPFLLIERPTGRSVAPSSSGKSGRPAALCRGSEGNQQHVDALGALLAQLHRLSAPDPVRAVLPRIDAKHEWERAVNIARQFKDAALMEALDELNQEQVEASPPCVLHGDPQLAGLRYDARGITAWIGWENAAIGDPRWDVAHVANEVQNVAADSLVERFYKSYADRGGVQLYDMTYWQAWTAIHHWAAIRQTHPELGRQGFGSRPAPEPWIATQFEQCKQQTWWALVRLRETRTTTTQPAT